MLVSSASTSTSDIGVGAVDALALLEPLLTSLNVAVAGEAQPATLGETQPDPLDDTHFTIAYELGGKRGVVVMENL